MSENTSSTNVDSGKKDKYSEDIEKGVPSINSFCEEIKEQDSGIEIAVDPNLVGNVSCNEIEKAIINAQKTQDARYLPIEIAVHTVSREELDKIKATLKARQAAQEKAMDTKSQDEKEVNEQEK